MNYTIIQDEHLLKQFIASLPDLLGDEKIYFTLLARKKYWPVIKADKGQLKRGLATKENLFNKIRQLEAPLGSYQFEDQEIPQEALAMYCMPNPRSLTLATRKSLVKFAELIANDNKGYNPHQEVLSAVQQSKSRGIYLDFDFDQEECPYLEGVLNEDSYQILKTRGGYHCLVETHKIAAEFRHTFYKKMQDLGCDVSGDCLIPIPGCYQGGFVPHFI